MYIYIYIQGTCVRMCICLEIQDLTVLQCMGGSNADDRWYA